MRLAKRVAVQADEAIAPSLSAAAFRAGFSLYALSREQRTLETVFAEVNAVLWCGGSPHLSGELRRRLVPGGQVPELPVVGQP